MRKLKDFQAKSKIDFRIQKLETDAHFGDCKAVEQGSNELKINYAIGYWVYSKEVEGEIVIFLIGGDKSSQSRDIEKAQKFWKEIKKQRDDNDKV